MPTDSSVLDVPPALDEPSAFDIPSALDLRLTLALPFFLALVMLWVFLPGLDNQLVSDDWTFVYRGAESESVRDVLDNTGRGWFWRPVIWLASYVVAQVSGLEAMGYNAISIGFHLANATLFGALLNLLWIRWHGARSLSRPRRRSMVLGGAAVFLFYPLHHEAVFWYSSLTELTALFGRLSVLIACVLALAPRPDPAPAGRTVPRVALIAAMAVSGVALALASKESAVVMPVEVFLVIALTVAPRAGRARRDSWDWRALLRPRAAWAVFLFSSAATLAWLHWYRSTRGLSVGQLMVLEATPSEWVLRVSQGVVRAVFAGPVVRDSKMLAMAALAGGLVVLLAWWRGQRLVVFGAGWMVLSLLPYLLIGSVADHEARVPVVFRIIGIGDDRYYYGAGAAVALLALALVLWCVDESARWGEGAARWARLGGLGLLLALALWGAWRLGGYERQWHAAGERLDLARSEIAAQIALPVAEREVICVLSRPDTLEGRYVLRNGFNELLWLHAGHRRFRAVGAPIAARVSCAREISLGE